MKSAPSLKPQERGLLGTDDTAGREDAHTVNQEEYFGERPWTGG